MVDCSCVWGMRTQASQLPHTGQNRYNSFRGVAPHKSVIVDQPHLHRPPRRTLVRSDPFADDGERAPCNHPDGIVPSREEETTPPRARAKRSGVPMDR